MWLNKDDCFVEFDVDGDKRLSLKEFLCLCKRLFQNDQGKPYPLDEDNIKFVFNLFDTNEDRFIDKDEFKFVWNQWIKVILNPVCALLIVDVQNDFISGSLGIVNKCTGLPEDAGIVKPINELLETTKFDVVAYSLDWHPENHISFFENIHLRKLHETSLISSMDAKAFDTVVFEGPPIMEQNLWPKHAIKHTWGAELHKDLKVVAGAIKVYKGTNPEIDAYSAFWDNLKKDETPLRVNLKDKNVTDLFICGLAYDFCVGETALDALKAGFRTIVIDDCTAGISPDSTDTRKASITSKHGLIVKACHVPSMVLGNDRRPELGHKLALQMKNGNKYE